MKKLLVGLSLMFLCTIAIAQTINVNWKVGNTTYTTNTCEVGGDLIIPQTNPTKYGYHFVGWAPYVFLEYIESTGSQYINTGVINSSDIGIDVTIQYTNLSGSGEQYSFGEAGYIDGGRFALGKNSNKNFLGYDTLATNISGLEFAENTTYNIKLGLINNTRQASVNSSFIVDLSAYNNWTDTRSIPLFCRFSGNSTPQDLARAKMYSAKLYNNNSLVRDLVPAKRNSDKAIGMYDIVTGRFFENAGTGKFIAGPEIQQ